MRRSHIDWDTPDSAVDTTRAGSVLFDVPDVAYMDHAVIGVKEPAPGLAPIARATGDRNTGPR